MMVIATTLNMRRWVEEFVNAYREEAFKLSDEEIEAFGEYSKEQLLSAGTQVEVLQFNSPDRLVLLFLFDKTKKDLQTTLTKLSWKNLNIFVACLSHKYAPLRFDPKEMFEMLSDTGNAAPKNMNYSINFITDVCCISFTRDVRIEALPIQCGLKIDSAPESCAKTIFHLNHTQAQDASTT
jgi:hypothetical protein